MSNAGHLQIPPRGRQTRGNTSSKRHQSERPMDGNTVDRSTSKHKLRHTDLTWDEFLHGYALPFSDQRVDPLNQQRAIRWTIGTCRHIPEQMRRFPRCEATSWNFSVGINKKPGDHMEYTPSRSSLRSSSHANLGGDTQSLIAHINTASRRGTDSSCTMYTTIITGHWLIYSWDVDHG